MALDRPAGVTRNTGLGRVRRSLTCAGIAISPSVRRSRTRAEPDVGVDAFNLLNRVNYQNFIGALTSPFYGRAVATQPPRRLQIGLRFQF